MAIERSSLDKINQRLEDLKKKVIQAGILGGQYEDGTNIAYVGAIQEFGSPEANIPARPFMRSTSADRRREWIETMANGIAAVAAGQLTAEQLLEQVGSLMAADIQKTISNIQSPPLSPITVMLRGMRSHDPNLKVTGRTVGEAAQRVADGETDYGASTKPLVDIGILLKSISYKVGDNT